MTTHNLAFLLLKTILDCTSRILLFATFMFVVNEGQFSTMMTVKVYYTTVAVIMAYNIVFNDNETYCSARTWIGGYQTIIFLNLPFLANFYKLTGMSGTYYYYYYYGF